MCKFASGIMKYKMSGIWWDGTIACMWDGTITNMRGLNE